MTTLRTITFAYRSKEDRVLAGINLGQPDLWACWLTRRLSLAVLAASEKFLTDTSPLAPRTALDHRRELAAFEREAALATTAQSVSATPPEVINTGLNTAELAERLTITKAGEHFRLEFVGDRGSKAGAVVQRAELQRMLRMLEDEISKAGWVVPSAAPPASAQEGPPKSVRH
jgi:hypothetical protein